MNDYITGIDIGTNSIKIIVSEYHQKIEEPYILHAIESPSYGFQNGYVIDLDEAIKSLIVALNKARKITKKEIKKANFSIGGIGMISQYIRTSIEIDRKKGEINNYDIHNLIKKSESLFSQKYPNKKILHIIPIKYLVDGHVVLGNPIGMYGTTLEAKIVFITILEHHYESINSVIEESGIEIQDIVASPIADSKSSIGYQQKSQGCILINIGAETSSFSTFENGNITSVKISNIGSSNITNDIALCVQTPLDVAEDVKLMKNDSFSKQKIKEIIYARFADILDAVERHLKSLNKNRTLPAGIIFSGGGSLLEDIEELTKSSLHLPTKKVIVQKYSNKTKRNSNIGPQFSVAYGLCFKDSKGLSFRKKFDFRKIKGNIINLFKQMMP